MSDQLQDGYELLNATEEVSTINNNSARQDKFLAYVNDMDSEEEAAEQKHSSCIVLPSNDNKFKFLANEPKKSPRNCNQSFRHPSELDDCSYQSTDFQTANDTRSTLEQALAAGSHVAFDQSVTYSRRGSFELRENSIDGE